MVLLLGSTYIVINSRIYLYHSMSPNDKKTCNRKTSDQGVNIKI